MSEKALTFSCEDKTLVGILHSVNGDATRGVLLVVGGPQYRVGSHRQFLLLARHLAKSGIPVFRFDYRGMGDSDGDMRDFEVIDVDIRAAIDVFFKENQGLKDVVIWGLCDAAAAASFYAHQDERISGLVLLNPWVRTETGIAKAHLKHYYLSRFLDPDLWKKLGRGEFRFGESIGGLISMLRSAFGLASESVAVTGDVEERLQSAASSKSLPARMLSGLQQYRGQLLFILSGDDITANEFRDVVNASKQWRKLLSEEQVTEKTLHEANHTFSQRVWRDKVANWTESWVKSF